jgi:hypothetical protein
MHTATDPLERFIPISREEIQNDLLQLPLKNIEEQSLFNDFCQLIVALYHFNFHRLAEQLKQHYQPFNPDTDIISKQTFSPSQLQHKQQQFIELVSKLLNHANYEQFSKPTLEAAIADGVGEHGLSVTVDLDDYEAMLAFYRGSVTQILEKRTWKTLFLWKQRCEIPIYKRVIAVLKFKPIEHRVKELIAQGQTEAQARRWVRKSRANLPDEIVDNHIFLKLFKNVPRLDIEVLFPNQQVRLKLFDKIRLAVTGGGGTIGGIVATVTKLAVTLNPMAIAVAFAGLAAIIARQVMGFFNLHTKYLMQLSRNLYFHNLDNNLGVVGHLVDAAEEEECKEAILAYYFLHTQCDQYFTQVQLDQTIENYLREKYGIAIDFEVADGVRKLRELGLLVAQTDGRLQVVDLAQACELLDTQWDNFFQYHRF